MLISLFLICSPVCFGVSQALFIILMKKFAQTLISCVTFLHSTISISHLLFMMLLTRFHGLFFRQSPAVLVNFHIVLSVHGHFCPFIIFCFTGWTFINGDKLYSWLSLGLFYPLSHLFLFTLPHCVAPLFLFMFCRRFFCSLSCYPHIFSVSDPSPAHWYGIWLFKGSYSSNVMSAHVVLRQRCNMAMLWLTVAIAAVWNWNRRAEL